MPNHRFFTPDARQLVELHAMALAEFHWPDVDPDAQEDLPFAAMDLSVDNRSAGALAARLEALTSRRCPSIEALLAQIAVQTAHARVLRLRNAAAERRLAAYAAMMLVGELAGRCGYVIDELEKLLVILNRQRASQAALSTRAWLSEYMRPNLQPRVRYLLLTPLTQAGRAEQDAVLEVSACLEALVASGEIVLDVPGSRLPADGAVRWNPELMYAIERDHILSADGVLLVAGSMQSYGSGQSQSWADANLASVHVVSAHTSRVLGAGYWGTCAEPWVDAPTTAASATRQVTSKHAAMSAHARECGILRRAWTQHVLLQAPRFLLQPTGGPLPARRLDALTSNPLEVGSLSTRELAELRETSPAEFDATIGLVLEDTGAIGGRTNGADEARPGHPDAAKPLIAETGSARALPDVTTVETILAARPMREPQRSVLREFCDHSAVTPGELNVVLALADNQFAPEMAHRSALDVGSLTRWLRLARADGAEANGADGTDA